MESEMRKCKQCGEIKPLTPKYYHRDKGCKGGFRRVCKDCRNGRSGADKRKAKDGYKICSKCEEEKPLTIEYWSKNNSTKDGFHTICKACRNKTDKVIIPIDESDGFRTCSKCGIRKPLVDKYFTKSKDNKEGFKTICRACLSKYNKIMRNTYKEGYDNCRICYKEYKINEDNFPKDEYFKTGFSDVCHHCNKIINKIKSQTLKLGHKFCINCGEQYPETKEYFFRRGNHFDTTCKKCRGYEFGTKQSVMNREKIDGYKYCTECGDLLELTTKNFYKSNSVEDGFTTKCKKCIRIKQKENITVIRKNKRIYQQHRRSRKKKLPSTFNQEQWTECKEYFNNSCCYCGEKTVELQQDHFIPISKGGHYTNYNIVPACQGCNVSKKDNDFKEWYLQQKFYSKERENKILRYLKSNS